MDDREPADVDCGWLDEADLTPFGRVVERISRMTLAELMDASQTDPDFQAALDQVSRPAPDHGCSGPGYCAS